MEMDRFILQCLDKLVVIADNTWAMSKKKNPKIKFIIILTAATIFYFAGSIVLDLMHLPAIDNLAKKNPARTALMEQRVKEARARKKPYRISQSYLPYNAISPYLKKAVLVAEDAAFFSHQGIDYGELKEAIKTDWKKKRWARGGSTITMQLAKNLYLSTSKSLTRKISEAVLARRMDDQLSKARIFELYLNYIEWGDGIFGCQSASLIYFDCSASELDPELAIRLASIIVNPRKYGPFTDSKRMNTRRKWIAQKMLQYGHLTEEEYSDLNF
jgi:monofunctional biosynthetic peptidoglycan transglycosylase